MLWFGNINLRLAVFKENNSIKVVFKILVCLKGTGGKYLSCPNSETSAADDGNFYKKVRFYPFAAKKFKCIRIKYFDSSNGATYCLLSNQRLNLTGWFVN